MKSATYEAPYYVVSSIIPLLSVFCAQYSTQQFVLSHLICVVLLADSVHTGDVALLGCDAMRTSGRYRRSNAEEQRRRLHCRDGHTSLRFHTRVTHQATLWSFNLKSLDF